MLTKNSFMDSHLRILKNVFYLVHSQLKSVLNYIDVISDCSFFLSSNDSILKTHYVQQES